MGVGFRRHYTTETLTHEEHTGTGDQLESTYAAGVSVEGFVRRSDHLVFDVDGNEVTANATIWIDGEQDVEPSERDRMTLEDGTKMIVLTSSIAKKRDGTTDHVKLECQDE